MIAFEGQRALITAERREIIRGGLILIRYPIAEPSNTRWSIHATLTLGAREYFHFLFTGKEFYEEMILRSYRLDGPEEYRLTAFSSGVLC